MYVVSLASSFPFSCIPLLHKGLYLSLSLSLARTFVGDIPCNVALQAKLQFSSFMQQSDSQMLNELT